jgi:hypothetical protein
MVVFCVVVFFLPACTFSRVRVNDQDFLEKTEKIILGKTTLLELTDMLGQPINWVELPENRRMYIYSYGDSKTAGLTLILFNTLKTNTGFDSAYFVIDTEDKTVVEKYVGTKSKNLPWEFWAFGG